MRQRMNWKKSLISVASSLILVSCAGSPPKLERPVKLYNGTPSKLGVCRLTKGQVTAWAESIAQHQTSKAYAGKVINRALAVDALECIRADSAAFKGVIGILADDFRVLLQYQENLLYSCAKWKQ
jgi:hypothetical protein